MTEIPTDKKIPGKLTILFYLIYVIGDILFWFIALANGVISASDVGGILLSVPSILLFAVKFAILGGIYFLFMKKILNYDGTEKTFAESASYAKKLQQSTVPMEVIAVFVILPIIQFYVHKKGEVSFNPLAIALIAFGTSGIFACLADVIFTQEFERWIEFIPLKEEYCASNIRRRGIMLAAFNYWGILGVISGIILGYKGEAINGSTNFLFTHLLPNFIILTGTALFTTHYQFSGFRRRIFRLRDAVVLAAKGDYASIGHISVSTRDGFGIISTALNDFVEQTKTLIGGIKETTVSSGQAASRVKAQTEQTASIISKITDITDVLLDGITKEAEGIEKVNSKTEDISQSIKQLNSDIERQSDAVEKSSTSIAQMVENIRSVTNILSQNALVVENLSGAATDGRKKIADAVSSSEKILKESATLLDASNVIQNLASQTNLLSMNAAIEASHAGESGKGFSVVAGEIRKLAEDSDKQGKMITQSLTSLQESIQGITSATLQVQSQFNTIYNLTNEVRNKEITIKNAMDEQADSSGQVLEAVQEIMGITESVKNGSKLMLSNSDEIVKDMNMLADQTEEFGITISDVVTNGQEINVTVKNIKEASLQNGDVIANLGQRVERFKL